MNCLATIALILVSSRLVEGRHGSKRLRSSSKKQKPVKEHYPYQSRIIGGNDAPAGQYPFFVQWHGCGASLIHEDILLSAAHCDPIEYNDVIIGSHLRYNDSIPGAHSRKIVARRRHPQFNDTSLENDYMVMKLDSPVPIAPVQLNQYSSSPAAQEMLTVIGFGLKEEAGTDGSDTLLEVNVKSFSFQECEEKYGREVIQENMFCAGTLEGGKDSCQGDSGGPIIDEFGVQVGVVSWGYGCGQADYPGVYARVSGNLDWINEQICDLSDLKPLSCGRDPTMPPTTPPEGSLPVQISLALDDYPEEVSLELLQGSEVLYRKNEGTFSGMQSFSDTLHLLPGDYALKLVDSFRDGMCCRYGNGTYEVTVSFLDGNAINLASGDGVFNDTLVIDVTVPEDPNAPTNESTSDPTMSPMATPPPDIGGDGDSTNAPTNESTSDPTMSPMATPPPDIGGDGDSTNAECEDNPSATFLVDSLVGTAGCAFLSLNMERYSYLCQFLQVAYGCPNTCNACAYF